MTGTLAITALLMGLAGGPHCVAMCGAACAGVIRLVRAPRGGVASLSSPAGGALAFQVGRVAGYAMAGAVVAAAVQSLAFASAQVAALRPVWMLLHVFVLAWALMLLLFGRQPLWAHRVGQALAARVRPWVGSPFGVLASGALWVLLPCGLLYSALMLAGLASGPAEGALVMALFAGGSGIWLALAPWLWRRLRSRIDAARGTWGTRIAGGLLALVAVQALGIDVRHQIAIWCGL